MHHYRYIRCGQSVGSNGLATARITTEHGSSSRIRQVAPSSVKVPCADASLLPKGIVIGSTVFPQYTGVTNTQTDNHTHTDHPTSSDTCRSSAHLARRLVMRARKAPNRERRDVT